MSLTLVRAPDCGTSRLAVLEGREGYFPTGQIGMGHSSRSIRNTANTARITMHSARSMLTGVLLKLLVRCVCGALNLVKQKTSD